MDEYCWLPAAPSVINKLVDAQDRALSFDAGARPVPKENFHLTLAFIGEIEETMIVWKYNSIVCN